MNVLGKWMLIAYLHNFIAGGSGEATGVSEELAEDGVSGDEGGDGEVGDGDLGPDIHHLPQLGHQLGQTRVGSVPFLWYGAYVK